MMRLSGLCAVNQSLVSLRYVLPRLATMARSVLKVGAVPFTLRLRRRHDLSCLILEIRCGETLIVNGASIRFRTKATVELKAHVRFVFGKQVMSREAAHTPLRHLYLALQTAYVGTAEEREPALMTARALAAALKESSSSKFTRDMLDRALGAALADDGFVALKFARVLVNQEDADRARYAIPESDVPRIDAGSSDSEAVEPSHAGNWATP